MAVIDDTPIDLNGEILCHGHERLFGVIEDLTAPRKPTSEGSNHENRTYRRFWSGRLTYPR